MNFFSNIISGVTNFFTPQASSAPPVSSFSNPVVTEEEKSLVREAFDGAVPPFIFQEED